MKVLKNKYRNPNRGCSRTWSAIKKGESISSKGTKWLLGINCNLSFWFDKWLDISPLCDQIASPLTFANANILVKDLIVNGRCDLSSCSFVFPQELHGFIKATLIPRLSMVEDRLSWASSSLGSFGSKRAFSLALNAPQPPPSWGIGFGKQIPSPIIWKYVVNSILMKNVLQIRGFERDTRCDVCHEAPKFVTHMIRDCSVTRELWNGTGALSVVPNFHKPEARSQLKKIHRAFIRPPAMATLQRTRGLLEAPLR